MDNINNEKEIEADKTPVVEVEDETELDKALEESIASVKAGNELASKKEEAKPEEVVEETPPKEEDTSKPPTDEAKSEEEKTTEYEFRIPNKGKFESDESYEKRIELLDLVKRKKLAKTDEQRQQLSVEINTTKNQLKTINGTDRFVNPLNEKKAEVTDQPIEEDELLKADKERLKALGGVTKEDIQEIVQKERLATEVKTTLDTFVGRHKELGDEDVREVFFDFVDSNFNWQGKSGKELMTVLELARESMFKPSESIQERVLKAANVQEKVNAMQFPGGTIAKTDYSPDMRKSLDELIATGMSEEKALELLSD